MGHPLDTVKVKMQTQVSKELFSRSELIHELFYFKNTHREHSGRRVPSIGPLCSVLYRPIVRNRYGFCCKLIHLSLLFNSWNLKLFPSNLLSMKQKHGFQTSLPDRRSSLQLIASASNIHVNAMPLLPYYLPDNFANLLPSVRVHVYVN